MPRRVPLVFESISDVKLEFQAASGFSSIKVFADAKELKKKKGAYHVPRSDGSTAELKVKFGLDFTNPSFVHGNETVQALPSIPVPLIILAMLPIGLVGVGGAIGGGLGGGAFMLNMGLMRSDQDIWVRILLCIGITALAVGAWVGIAAAISG